MSNFSKLAPNYELAQDKSTSRKNVTQHSNAVTGQRMTEVRMAFSHYDGNSDGYLNRYELRRLLTSFAIDPDNEYAIAMVNELGPSEFFQFSLEHVILLIGNLAPRQSVQQEILTAFECLDPMLRGLVPAEDVSRVIKGCIRGCGFPLNNNNVDEIIESFTNDDGKLDYVRLMEKLQI